MRRINQDSGALLETDGGADHPKGKCRTDAQRSHLILAALVKANAVRRRRRLARSAIGH